MCDEHTMLTFCYVPSQLAARTVSQLEALRGECLGAGAAACETHTVDLSKPSDIDALCQEVG